jgi:hypothetical protein
MAELKIEHDVRGELVRQGFAWIPRPAWVLNEELEQHWEQLRLDWDHLELDRYLLSGRRFRLRRYGRYYWSPADGTLAPLPHQPYFQDAAENSYAGGIERDFAPLLPATVNSPVLGALVRSTFACLPVAAERQGKTWEVRIHQIRVVATPEEPGLPTPEGIHQDGTDFLSLHLVQRRNIAGGDTTIYDLNYRPIAHHTLQETLDSFVLEDPRIMHGVTPVCSADGRNLGVRDLLGVDFIYSPDLEHPGGLS